MFQDAVADGTVIPLGITLAFGITEDLGLNVQFIDQGDASVPDGGSTLTLLGGALTLFGAMSRNSGTKPLLGIRTVNTNTQEHKDRKERTYEKHIKQS